MALEYNLKNFANRVAGLWMCCVHLLDFVSEKCFIRSLAGNFSGLVNLLENAEIGISANRAIVRVDCRNPEIW